MTDRQARATAALKALYADPVQRARLLDARHGVALWTRLEDGYLLRGKGSGLSNSQIAEYLGRSTNAVIGRYHRLMKEQTK